MERTGELVDRAPGGRDVLSGCLLVYISHMMGWVWRGGEGSKVMAPPPPPPRAPRGSYTSAVLPEYPLPPSPPCIPISHLA